MMTQDAAETVALQGLGWIAGQEDLMGVFLGSTGVSESDLKTQVAEPEFLAAVLDFLLMDDAWVQGAAEAASLPPERLMEARAALPGGAQVNWT